MIRRIVVNAGGKKFETLSSTLLKYPNSAFAAQFNDTPSLPTSTSVPLTTPALQNSLVPPPSATSEYFLDVDPKVFEWVLNFLRAGICSLPVNDEPFRRYLLKYLQDTELFTYAFAPASATTSQKQSPSAAAETNGNSSDDTVGEEAGEGEDDESMLVELPDVCVVQLCDHMQSDAGSKRHAMTITYGAEGFQLRHLTQRIRADLNGQVAASFWQVYQTTERSAFFVTTKVANGTADILSTSISQQVVQHTESMGYQLSHSYVTLSPDVVHTKVRLFIHNLIFRRVRLPELQLQDVQQQQQLDGGEEEGEGMVVSPNFEKKSSGPKESMWGDAPSVVPEGERANKIWD